MWVHLDNGGSCWSAEGRYGFRFRELDKIMETLGEGKQGIRVEYKQKCYEGLLETLGEMITDAKQDVEQTRNVDEELDKLLELLQMLKEKKDLSTEQRPKCENYIVETLLLKITAIRASMKPSGSTEAQKDMVNTLGKVLDVEQELKKLKDEIEQRLDDEIPRGRITGV